MDTHKKMSETHGNKPFMKIEQNLNLEDQKEGNEFNRASNEAIIKDVQYHTTSKLRINKQIDSKLVTER